MIECLKAELQYHYNIAKTNAQGFVAQEFYEAGKQAVLHQLNQAAGAVMVINRLAYKKNELEIAKKALELWENEWSPRFSDLLMEYMFNEKS